MFAVFVGDLHPEVSELMLLNRLSPAGPIESVYICRDRQTGSPLGYAYVNFQHRADAERAIIMFNFELLLDRPMRVMWSRWEPTAKLIKGSNVIIKNLHQSIDDIALFDTFSVFGRIVSCKVVESKGFGFIQFESPEAAAMAIRQVNGMILKGLQVTIKYFKSLEERKAEDQNQGNNLYIKNLDNNIDTECLYLTFAQFGHITSAKVIMENGRSKGFGFVNFTSSQDAMRAMNEMNGMMWGKKQVFVELAKRKEDGPALLQRMFIQQFTPSLHQPVLPLYLKTSIPAVETDRFEDLVPIFTKTAVPKYHVEAVETAAPEGTTKALETAAPECTMKAVETAAPECNMKAVETDAPVDKMEAVETAEPECNMKAMETASPVEAVETASPVEAVETASPVEAVETAAQVDAVEAVETAAPVDTVEAVETAAPVDTEEAVETADPEDAVEAVETDSPVDAVEAVETDSPVDAVEAVETDSPVDAVDAVKTDSPVDAVEAVETAAPVDTVETVETAAPVNAVEAVETAAAECTVEAVETAAPVDTVEAVETAVLECTVEAVETAAPVDTVEAVETAAPVDTVEAVETAYINMFPLVEQIHPSDASKITWMVIEGKNTSEIMNMLRDPELLHARVDEMDALLTEREAGCKPETWKMIHRKNKNKKKKTKKRNQ
ncbi:polyadenylate-binding protein 1A-like [Tachysurus fulvidraco]|uniref:polyadenylate-binding protein 1A-like n=1 Tax=Tachysurus fulvidraco TaxID=1234273 RepID=UPI001FEE40C4|nr:polyadenylate-binding protein 1A-like [Tachysurus fulvidraco]